MEAREEFQRLAQQAQQARQVYDALLLDPESTPSDLKRARVASEQADAARDRAAAALPATSAASSPPARRSGTRGAPASPRMGLVTGPPVARPGRPAPRKASPRRSRADHPALRELLANALDAVAVPMRAADLAFVVSAQTGLRLSPSQMTQTRREERRRYDTATERPELLRAVYLVPCLSADTLAPATGTYSLSSWPLPDRMVSPYAPRLWSCRAAANLAAALHRELRRDRLELTELAGADDGPPLGRVLARYLRGNQWGRDGNALTLKRLTVDAEAEAAGLAGLHAEHVADALTRLKHLTRDHPGIELWGLDRPGPAEEEGTG